MAEKSEPGANRRDFLKMAATAAPAAAAATVMTQASTAEAAEPVNETRLQDTAHTRAFYTTARF